MDNRVLAEVIKLRMLNWEIILETLGGPKCNHKCTYKREADDLTWTKEVKATRHGGRDWKDTATDRGMPGPPEAGRGEEWILPRGAR